MDEMRFLLALKLRDNPLGQSLAVRRGQRRNMLEAHQTRGIAPETGEDSPLAVVAHCARLYAAGDLDHWTLVHRSRSPALRSRSPSGGLILEALRVDLVDVLGAGGPGGEPAVGSHYLEAADRFAVTWRRVNLAVIGSPASLSVATTSGDNFSSLIFCSGVAGASMRV